MNDFLVVILIWMSTYRITRLIVSDTIIKKTRIRVQWWFESHYEKKYGGTDDDNWNSKIAYLLGCPWCMSIWVGAIVTLITDITAGVPLPVLTAIAASGVAGYLSTRET